MTSNCEMVQASSRQIGSYVMMENQFPCKVVENNCAMNGNHSAGKALITAKDIFTNKAYVASFQSKEMIEAPIVKKNEYQCIDIAQNGALTHLNEDMSEKVDVTAKNDEQNGDLIEQIRLAIEKNGDCMVTVLSFGSNEQVTACK